jgi:hypothetical protein
VDGLKEPVVAVSFGDPRLPDAFWKKVQRSSENECWDWIGAVAGRGYGYMTIRSPGEPRENVYSHRRMLEVALGRALRPDEQACHSCDRPPCVNPTHLFAGSKSDNMQDAKAKGRIARGEAHGAAKLTETDVRAIREGADAGATTAALARRHGVSDETVAKVLSRETWGHVDEKPSPSAVRPESGAEAEHEEDHW